MKEMLKEEVEKQDINLLYRLLTVNGPKITKIIKNLDKTYQDDPRWQEISKAWNNFTFGYGEFYHKNK